ncbi:MAG TPA: hypothetical protein VE261_01335 [Gaiellaceae bacterium]|nr:hypothetical protein [Gaiellaceae bacterium]
MTRKHLVTLAGAIGVVVVLASAAFALQALALRPPPAGSFVGLRAAKWIERYRLVSSTIALDTSTRPVHATCVQQWFSEGRHRRLGAVMRLDDGFVLVDIPPHTLVATDGTAADHRAAPLALLELAGCPHLLARALENLSSALQVQETNGGRAVRLRYHGTQLVVRLDAGSGKPVGIAVTSRRTSGTGRFRYFRLTPTLLRRLGAAALG